MNFLTKSKTTLAVLTLCVSLSSFANQDKTIQPVQKEASKVGYWVAAGIAATFAYTLWKHLTAFPFDGKNRYDAAEIKQALKEIACCKNLKKNFAILSKHKYYFYFDGICGHASKIGSPRFNDKTGLHEIPYVESRGLFGYVSDMIEPAKSVGAFLGNTAALYVVIKQGKESFDKAYATERTRQAIDATMVDIASTAKPAGGKK